MKRFWDTNYPGHPYDPVARRRGQSTDTPATLAPIPSSRATSVPGVAAARSGGKTPVSGHRSGSASAVNHEQLLGLQAQLKEMSAHLEGLEKERDFYFAKVCVRSFFSFKRGQSVSLCFSCAHTFLSLSCAISRSWCSNRRNISKKKAARTQRSLKSRKSSIPLRYAGLLFFLSSLDLGCMTLQEGFEVPDGGVAGADEEETF